MPLLSALAVSAHRFFVLFDCVLTCSVRACMRVCPHDCSADTIQAQMHTYAFILPCAPTPPPAVFIPLFRAPTSALVLNPTPLPVLSSALRSATQLAITIFYSPSFD